MGGYKAGKKEGFGVLIYKKGDMYQGKFKNDMFDGLGKYEHQNGVTYIGINFLLFKMES